MSPQPNNGSVALQDCPTINPTRYLEITTNIGCSNNCWYCPQDLLLSQYHSKSSMSLVYFDKYLAKIPKEVIIMFAGFSEPFLNHACYKMICHASQQHEVMVYTTLKGFEYWMFEYIEHIKFKFFYYHQTQKNKNILGMKLYNLSNFMEGGISLHDRAGNIPNLPHRYIKGKILCQEGMEHGVLLPNGDVVLCCMNYGLQHKLGNLTKQSYQEIFNSKELIKIKEDQLKEDSDILCRKCIYARLIQ